MAEWKTLRTWFLSYGKKNFASNSTCQWRRYIWFLLSVNGNIFVHLVGQGPAMPFSGLEMFWLINERRQFWAEKSKNASILTMANIYWALTATSALYVLTHSISTPCIITIITSILNMRKDRKNLSNLPMAMQLESDRPAIWPPVVWYPSQAESTSPSLLLGWLFVRQGLVEGCWWLEALPSAFGWKTKLIWVRKVSAGREVAA